MTTLTFIVNRTCAAGGHLAVHARVNSGTPRVIALHIDELNDAVTEDEVRSAVMVLMRLYKLGRTVAQARTGLTTGVTVTL